MNVISDIFFFFVGILGVLKVFRKHIIFILDILHHPENESFFFVEHDWTGLETNNVMKIFESKKQSEHTKNIHSFHATESHRVDSMQF